MGTIRYPFGVFDVVTLSGTTSFTHTVDSDCKLYLRGQALGGNATLALTAAPNLPAGTIVVVRWLSDGTARSVTVTPTLAAAGQAFAGTANKASTATLIYSGTVFIPIAHVQSIDV